MNDKVCLFAGTTEGRRLAYILKDAAELTVCVATEYGEVMLDGCGGINVHTGRLDERGMEAFFASGGFGLIIDATHPYAQEVSVNIRAAAEKFDIPVMRIIREADKKAYNAVYVDNVEHAKDYLAEHGGNVLITTGAKELTSYAGLDMSRVWVRVLPLQSSLEACKKAGIPTAHIIAAQGPFSEETNLALLRAIDAKFIVTKESGKSGGFDEKISAAKKAGATAVIVGKPTQGEGLRLDEAVAELAKRYELTDRKLYLIGIGPGGSGMLTAEAAEAIEECDAVIGAKTVVEAVLPAGFRKTVFYEFTPDKVKAVLDSHPSLRCAAILMRGDVGFYSGAKKLLELFGEGAVNIVPGISSVSAFAAKLGVSWDDARLISLHGRDANLIRAVDSNKKTFALTGGANTVPDICRKLCEYGFGALRVAVGERLSYHDEKITRDTAQALCTREFDALSVMYIENPDAVCAARFGIADEEFIRGDVPMTKSEVRAIVLSKLALTPDAVVWDIGAGTGSVSVECALGASEGKVYAVEKEPDALELIGRNKRKFRADNIETVAGFAPDALSGLAAPTHVFIGGSSGNLRKIIDAVLDKNPAAHIVLTAVTLETQAEAVTCAKTLGLDIDAAAVQISRSRKAGSYHMMIMQNQVFVYTLTPAGGKADA
ncbi:MAG: precorrin-6A reductase [Clostridia bacterium]|nr:precorrin-6A reductase [Clostridia bacterium]